MVFLAGRCGCCQRDSFHQFLGMTNEAQCAELAEGLFASSHVLLCMLPGSDDQCLLQCGSFARSESNLLAPAVMMGDQVGDQDCMLYSLLLE